VNFSNESIGVEQAQSPDGHCVPAREGAVAEAQGGSVGLSPLTVLLISGDRNFRIVVSLLLTRRGCAVTAGRLIESAGAQAGAGGLLNGERADVVVIDAGRSRARMTRSLRLAAALPPSVGVVLVADAARPDTDGPPLLARWGPFAELYAAIETAGRRRRVPCG
jgi:hypothetical protein